MILGEVARSLVKHVICSVGEHCNPTSLFIQSIYSSQNRGCIGNLNMARDLPLKRVCDQHQSVLYP